jgi:ATP-dependent Clp protease adaptor protein ClpS
VSEQSAVAVPDKTTDTKRKQKDDERRKRQPRYHVVLWDSDDHSYDYVIRMMQELFHHSETQGFVIAKAVDQSGRAICLTTTKEHAELKRDQIHAYGKDAIIGRCKGSMKASIEPEM